MTDVQASAYRKVLGSFPTGVTVVAAFDAEGDPWGLTANSFCSVSLDPPLILVCLDRRGRAWPVFAGAGRFSVNILAAEQLELARHFASAATNRFATVDWARGQAATPLLPESCAWLECETDRKIDAGDHVILLGAVVSYGHGDNLPLGFCHGAFFTPQIDL
ncbi:MAG: flavin reductase family protein [Geminicoccaceae bacterium]